MSTTALEKLMFTVGMNDMVSGPISSINRTIGGMKKNATTGFEAVRGGAFGLAGAGFAIKTFMEPVYDMQRSLGEVKSLNVAQSELDKLTKKSLAFSVKYGESATDFVKSSYDIQSAIGGLVNGELAEFTNASNVLAKATKSDAATVTNYMGTMYGIFADDAEKMGKAEWVKNLTGQTALAVQMFKTTGSQMSGAFTAVGANAQSAGISLTEQIAILGTLQSTMSGSEAGTKYKSFLAGVGKAQSELGLNFTDSQGRLLPMLQILEKVKGKFGDTLNVAESDALKKAFGSDEAVSLIKLLMTQTDGLNDSITKLGQNTGMANAEQMASAMVDPWEQFTAVTKALRISFGTLLLPTINELLSKMTTGLTTVMGWTQEFPNITRAVGYLTLGMLALGAAVGLGSIIVGLSRMAWAGMLGIWGLTKLAMWPILFLMKGMTAQQILLNIVFKSGTAILFVFSNAMKIIRAAMILMGIAATGATAPLWATVAVIAGIIAAVGWLIYKVGDWLGWWDKLADIMANTNWGKFILDMLGKIGTAFKEFQQWIGWGDDADINLNATKTTDIQPLAAMARAPEQGQAAAGMAANNKGNQTYWGGVTINTDSITPEDWEARAALSAG